MVSFKFFSIKFSQATQTVVIKFVANDMELIHGEVIAGSIFLPRDTTMPSIQRYFPTKVGFSPFGLVRPNFIRLFCFSFQGAGKRCIFIFFVVDSLLLFLRFRFSNFPIFALGFTLRAELVVISVPANAVFVLWNPNRKRAHLGAEARVFLKSCEPNAALCTVNFVSTSALLRHRNPR